ncbi:MAG: GTP cyclohydrolase I FolE [Candidatus Edwardsbacteria bacterium]|nr:GTP cyclohydrolase I FolE [Candidatus Edwardsbacteria bacterium]
MGEEPDREGLRETPGRVARMYQEIFAGAHLDASEELKVYTAKNEEELILVRDIDFYSMCEHHLLPFFGQVHIAYIPRRNKVTGFSSLIKVVESSAHRLQLQERMTAEIADMLVKKLNPLGVLVVVEAEHLCLTMRGVKKPGSKVVTSSIRGGMKRESTRLEALALIKG